MRILVAAAETAPPSYPSVAGIFGDGLVRLGHEVVGMFYDEPGPSDMPWPGEVLRVPRPQRQPLQRTAASVAAEWRAIARVLATARPFGAIVVRDDPIMALAALRWRHRHGPVIYQVSHLNPEEMADHARERLYGSPYANIIKALASRALRSMVLRSVDHVIVMTPEMREALALPETRSTIVGEGVSAHWAADMSPSEARALHQIPPEVPLLVYAGTLNRVRHLEVLIEAHAVLLATHPEARLLIVGSGRERDDATFLAGRVRELGLDGRVGIAGRVSHAHVAALFDAAHLVVSSFPATRVLRCNSPTRLFESMHRGRAVVAGDIPEQRRVVEAAGCGLLSPHTTSGLSAACRALLVSPTRAEMGARGRDWVSSRRTFDVLAQTVERVIVAVRGRVMSPIR